MKKTTKKTVKKAAARKAARPVKKSASPAARAKSPARLSWLDETGTAPQIDSHARKLRTFMEALADGVVDDAEVAAQEERLVKLMQDVEPQLDAALHARVTELLCELTAYDIMRLLHAMHTARPKHVFRG